MMSFFVILFFLSLISLLVMIGRKWILLKKGQHAASEETPFEVPYIRELRHIVTESIKKVGHFGTVVVLRIYIKSSNFFKSRYQAFKNKIKHIRKKNTVDGEEKEVSKLSKIVRDYKHKVREIKHKIKEEEKN